MEGVLKNGEESSQVSR